MKSEKADFGRGLSDGGGKGGKLPGHAKVSERNDSPLNQLPVGPFLQRCPPGSPLRSGETEAAPKAQAFELFSFWCTTGSSP